ncbi:UNVERIFIED_ORG: hypothetical protein M2420_002100 [Stenotrophomonas maltophilia]|jgi:hypothetical protein
MRPIFLLPILSVAGFLFTACIGTGESQKHASLTRNTTAEQCEDCEVAEDATVAESAVPSEDLSEDPPVDAADWDAIGKPCTEDCAGHDVGYQWAEGKGIAHPDDCGGNSQSFIEGREAYAEGVQRESISGGQCEDFDGDGLCD